MRGFSVSEERYAINGVELNVSTAGDPAAPAVVLLHGFPECAWSWRHQMQPVAAAGYHVLAPDQRGYATSSAPRDVEAYGIRALCGDVVALLDATEHDDAVVVGHDWGALVMWDLARLHPERLRAAIGVSVPYTPWPVPPTELFRALHGDNFFYILYFQDVGPAEAELEADVDVTMRAMLWGASGDGAPGAPAHPLPARGTGFLDVIAAAGPVPAELPPWLTAADLETYVDAFERSGFCGPLSWYRNMDANHDVVKELPAPALPTAFIGGTKDLVTAGRPGYVESMTSLLPDHRGSVLLDGVGHWTQQEAPGAFNEALLTFLRGLDPHCASSR
ncbi:MAG: alpha/beta hydrolase [Actinomycetota bacterium]|nr:alpha/beta hydrolase [Actinomycetota bacterium]